MDTLLQRDKSTPVELTALFKARLMADVFTVHRTSKCTRMLWRLSLAA